MRLSAKICDVESGLSHTNCNGRGENISRQNTEAQIVLNNFHKFKSPIWFINVYKLFFFSLATPYEAFAVFVGFGFALRKKEKRNLFSRPRTIAAHFRTVKDLNTVRNNKLVKFMIRLATRLPTVDAYKVLFFSRVPRPPVSYL